MLGEMPAPNDFRVIVPNSKKIYSRLIHIAPEIYPQDSDKKIGTNTFTTGIQLSNTPMDGQLFIDEFTNIALKKGPNKAASWSIDSMITTAEPARAAPPYGFYNGHRVDKIANLLRFQGLEALVIAERLKQAATLNSIKVAGIHNTRFNVDFGYENLEDRENLLKGNPNAYFLNELPYNQAITVRLRQQRLGPLHFTEQQAFCDILMSYADIYGRIIEALYQESGILLLLILLYLI